MKSDDSHFIARYLKSFAKTVSDLLFPPTCHGCGEHVSAPGSICPYCWQNIHFITPPYCPVMGLPFQYDPGDGFLSGEALQNPPVFDKARSAVIHDGLVRRLVTQFKYADRLELAPVMGQWMIRAGQDLIAESDLIIPVPLHRWRFFTRRYNQAAELARMIAAQTNLPFMPEALLRHKATHHQVGLNAKERMKNIKGAFSVSPNGANILKNKNILLIDDVYTTGATVNAAAKSLKKGGANKVFVLTFSRALPQIISNPTIEIERTLRKA